MAAEIEGGASMKSSEETKENNDDAMGDSKSGGMRNFVEHDDNADSSSVGSDSIVGGLPPSARPFRALLVDFSLATDDAQCVIALHWLEQHLLGLDRTQRVRECKQPFLKAITAKRNKSAAANARLTRKAERDRVRRIASGEKAKRGSGGGAAAEVDGDGDEGSQPFQLDAEEADGDLPKRRKSFAQRLGKLAINAASAVAKGSTRSSSNLSPSGSGGHGGNSGAPDRTAGGSVSPTSPSSSFRASLSRRSGSMMATGSVAVDWGDNVHHTVTAVLKCYFDLSPIDTVPPVLMEHVFSYLHITKHHDLCAVCSEWDQYASGDVLWREIYFMRFKTFDHEEPIAPAALAAPAAAATAAAEGGAAGGGAPVAAPGNGQVGGGEARTPIAAGASGAGGETSAARGVNAGGAGGGTAAVAPATPVRNASSSGGSRSALPPLPFGEPAPRTPSATTAAASATGALSSATRPNEQPISEQHRHPERTPPPSSSSSSSSSSSASSRYPSLLVTPPPSLFRDDGSSGVGGSSVYSGGSSEQPLLSSSPLDSSPAALSATLRRQHAGGDTVNTHGFKALFYRRLLDPWIGDHVEVAWRGKFRLEAMEVYQGLAWWEAVVVDKEVVAPVAAASAADPAHPSSSSTSPVPGSIHRSPTLRGSSGYGTRLNENNNGNGGAAAGSTASHAASAAGLSARYKIHYPGWISRWDEWVDRSRLRWSWHTNNEAAIKTGDEVEVWCTGNNVPGAWLEAKVKKVRGLKFDVGKVLAGGTLWVEREKVRLVWKRSAEVHSRSLIGFTTRSLFPKPRRLMNGAAATSTAHPHASSSSHSPSIHVAPLNVHHSTRASPPGGGQYINGPHIGAQHRHHHQHHRSGSGGGRRSNNSSGGSGNTTNDGSGSGGSARSLVFGRLRRSPQSSSSSSSSRPRRRRSNTPIALAPVEHNENRRRNGATSSISTRTNNNSQRRSNPGFSHLRSPSAAAAAPTVGLNRRASSASALGSSSSISPGENRLRKGSEDGQRRHTHSESQISSRSSSSDDDDDDDDVDDNEEGSVASILRDHLPSPLPPAPASSTRSSPTSNSGNNHHTGTNRILHAARKLNTNHQELYGRRESESFSSSGSDQDEGDGFANVTGVSQSSRAAAAAEEDDDNEIDGTLSHYDEAALADEEAMLQYWRSQRNVVRSSRASSAHTYPLRNTHPRSSAGGSTETASPALTAADQRHARHAAAAIDAEQRNPHSGVASQRAAGAGGAPAQSQGAPTARRRLSMQNALWPFVWKSRSSRQRRESI